MTLSPSLPPCPHPEVDRARRACVHLRPAECPSTYQAFDGDGLLYLLACAECRGRVAEGGEVEVERMCEACFRRLEEESAWDSGELGILGRPAPRIGADRVTVERGEEREAPFLKLACAATCGEGWLLWADGRPWRVGEDGAALECAAVEPPPGEKLTLCGSPSGRWAALVDQERGIVWEVSTGRTVLELGRGDYHSVQTLFPLAFVRQFAPQGDREVLLHATDWNRLDAFDPEAGRSLTERASPRYRRGVGPEPHYLDYFHGHLAVSPEGTRVADAGWHWHPVGVVASWSLSRWLEGEVWESEDGPSRTSFADRDYFWDAPMCWLDERSLAVWGYGNDDLNLLDAISIYDAERGELVRWFPGPARGPLHLDGELLVSVGEEGSTFWDPRSGERVGRAEGWRPVAFHPRLRRYLCAEEGRLRVDRLA